MKISESARFRKAIKSGFIKGYDERMCFVDEALIDDIKFGICFENYLKAMLLAEGYIVHDIRGANHHKESELKKLAGRQKKSLF